MLSEGRGGLSLVLKESSTVQGASIQSLNSFKLMSCGPEVWLQLVAVFPLAPLLYIKTLQISFQDLKIIRIYKESQTSRFLEKLEESDHRRPGFSCSDP